MHKWQKDEKEIKLIWAKRAEGTILPRRLPYPANPAAPPRQDDADDRDHGGRGHVYWDKDKGTPCLTSSINYFTCNCGGAANVSVYNSTVYFTALRLFDTGAYTSFVNREVAKLLEQQQHGGTVAAMSSPADMTSLHLRLAWQARS